MTAFHELLADSLRSIGFIPSRADQDFWWKKSTDYSGYDYIVTHVDDLLIGAKNPQQHMSKLTEKFTIKNIVDDPSTYLGVDIKRKNGILHLSC